MEKNMFCVTSPNGKVTEYFDNRDSAIAFIVDEFSMAVTFRTDVEGEKLTEYMQSHNETPNQYPYKYVISEVKVNHEYDKPKSIYLVKVDRVVDCVEDDEEYLFHNYEDAREYFDNIVDEDMYKYGSDKTATCELNPFFYDRWDENELHCVWHLSVYLLEYEDKNGKLTLKK